MRVLFICTANRDRSRTAEIYFQNKYPEYRFRSAGISKYLSERHGGVVLKQYMLDVADRIVCSEQIHYDFIVKNFDVRYKEKMEVLELGDTDTFMSKQLIDQLERFAANRMRLFSKQSTCRFLLGAVSSLV